MTTPAHFKRPESVLVVIHTPANDILMLHRVAPSDFWQSVTGSLEIDETPAEAAVREIAEETGLVAQPAELRDWQLQNHFAIPRQWAARYAPGTRFNREHAFSLCLPERCPVRINPTEHNDAKWVPVAQAIDMAWSWSNRDLLHLLGHDNPRANTTPCRAVD